MVQECGVSRKSWSSRAGKCCPKTAALSDLADRRNVGIGTDFTQGYGQEFFDWITHDKGYARRLTNFGDVINPEGLRTIGEWPNLTAAMERRGWSAGRSEAVIGNNWFNLLRNVWGA